MSIIRSSILIKLLKNIRNNYFYCEKGLYEIYKNSQIDKIIQGLQNKIKISFRYSFLWKISAIREKKNISILNKSMAISFLINSYKRYKQIIILYFKRSLIDNSTGVLKKELYVYPIKTISLIIVAAVLTNIAFSILFKNEIGLLNWFLRVLLLFVGTSGLASDANWPTVRSNSIIVKLLLKNKCAESAEK